MKRRRKRGTQGDGRLIERFAAREAYHDALYAILLEAIEKSLRDPRRRDKVDRAMRYLLEDILKDYE